MQPELRRLVRSVSILLAFGSTVPLASAQSAPQAATLFQQVQSDQTTAGATEQLLRLGRSDTEMRAYLAAHLPSLIAAGPHPSMSSWSNATRLAGSLKIVEAAPALAKFIGVTTEGGALTLGEEANLKDSPAGLALVQIGDAADSALASVLERGNSNERWRAAYALNLIGSAKAKTVLSAHAPRETDDTLRAFIARVTTQ